jgi:predicted XRE-type DNA-binding protein
MLATSEYNRNKINSTKLTRNSLVAISNKPLITPFMPTLENAEFVRTLDSAVGGVLTSSKVIVGEDLSSNEKTNELKTKDQLIEKIKEWVKIDNEIRVLQKEQKKRLADKKKVSGELMAVMRSNEIDAFDLNDGQILYDKRNLKKPITKTALLSILTTYYKGDAVKASETNQYILDNREEVVREKIVRKITKPANTKTQNK